MIEGSNLGHLAVLRVSNPLPCLSANHPTEGEGIEPSSFRMAWFSGPVARHGRHPPKLSLRAGCPPPYGDALSGLCAFGINSLRSYQQGSRRRSPNKIAERPGRFQRGASLMAASWSGIFCATATKLAQ